MADTITKQPLAEKFQTETPSFRAFLEGRVGERPNWINSVIATILNAIEAGETIFTLGDLSNPEKFPQLLSFYDDNCDVASPVLASGCSRRVNPRSFQQPEEFAAGEVGSVVPVISLRRNP